MGFRSSFFDPEKTFDVEKQKTHVALNSGDVGFGTFCLRYR